jgi:predicted lipase
MGAWLAKQYLLSKLYAWIGKKVVKRMQRKYNLGQQYKQEFTKSHDVNWREIKHYAELAKLIYEKDTKKITDKYPDVYVNVIKKIRYMLITDVTAKTYTIVIRGTSNFRNAMQDMRFHKDKSNRLDCKLHRGFHKAAEMIFDDLSSKMSNTEYTIHVTGHSLGGAEALIVGAYCSQAKMNLGKIITFGQPKVFDRDGMKKWGHLPLTRVVNETDIVPLVPPVELIYMFKRYVHFGEMIKLCNDEYYCFLEQIQARNNGVNSFWLNAAKEGFSVWEMFKELPDHYMDSYLDNINPKIKGGKELLWKDREQYLEDPKKKKK